MQTLETEHLRLIPFSLELKRAAMNDKARVAQRLKAQVPDSWPGPDMAEALPFFVKLMEQDPSGSVWDGIILHKAERILIGTMGFKGGPDQTGTVEMGYSIIPEYRGRGYAPEMARALISWAFGNQRIRSVIAECLADNTASIRVLEKIGMQRLGLEGKLLKWEIRKPQ